MLNVFYIRGLVVQASTENQSASFVISNIDTMTSNFEPTIAPRPHTRPVRPSKTKCVLMLGTKFVQCI